LREYDEEVRRLQAIIVSKTKENDELRLQMIDPNEVLNLRQLLQTKNEEIEVLKRSPNQLEQRLRDIPHLENELRRLTDILNQRDREIADLRNRTQTTTDTTYYDRQIAELNRIVRQKDFEIEGLRKGLNLIEAPAV
jgi:Rad3-related DNA helicase